MTRGSDEASGLTRYPYGCLQLTALAIVVRERMSSLLGIIKGTSHSLTPLPSPFHGTVREAEGGKKGILLSSISAHRRRDKYVASTVGLAGWRVSLASWGGEAAAAAAVCSSPNNSAVIGYISPPPPPLLTRALAQFRL